MYAIKAISNFYEKFTEIFRPVPMTPAINEINFELLCYCLYSYNYFLLNFLFEVKACRYFSTGSSQVLLLPAINYCQCFCYLRLIITCYRAINFRQFHGIDENTGQGLITCVNNMGNNLSLTLLKSLTPAINTKVRIFPQIFVQIRNGPNGIHTGPEETES